MIDIDTIAANVLAATDEGATIPTLSDREPTLSLDAAYRIQDAATKMRAARGERQRGWKIGFTNVTIWEEYGVHAPIWGPVWDETLRASDFARPARLSLTGLAEPRIEPEIVFRFARTPQPGADEDALLDAIDGIGHGFEIVQSIYAGWRFKAADTIAAFSLHGRLMHGPFVDPAAAGRAHWRDALERFSIVLLRDGVEIDRGSAGNVLGGPLTALRHFADGLAACPLTRGIEPGDVVTTGTLTRAFPVKPGEIWTTRLEDIGVPGAAIAFE